MSNQYTEVRNSEVTGAVIAVVIVAVIIVTLSALAIAWSEAVRCAVTLAC